MDLRKVDVDSVRRKQLLEEGYCVFPDILSPDKIETLRLVSGELFAKVSPEDREKYKYQGSNIRIEYQHPVFAELLAWPHSLHALLSLGFISPKFLSGYILLKAPGAPPLYWHQDWPYWGDPVSGRVEPPQVFLMYYLVDTSRANGCLRVIPGSHLRRVPLHDEILEAHTQESYHSDPSSRMFRIQADEVDVAVKAGDLVIGDARVLHSAHGNTSHNHRPVITLWYAPDFDSLTESVKVAMVGQSHELFPIPHTPRDIELMRDLLPSFEGSVEPARWNRVPDRYLRRD